MSNLIKYSSGQIARLAPDSSLDSTWLHHGGHVQFWSTRITFPHREMTRVLLNELPLNAVIEIHYNFLPGVDDKAGITIYQNDRNHMDISVLRDVDSTQAYNRLKVIKTEDRYTAFAKTDTSEWIFIGTETSDFPGHIGVFAETYNNAFELLEMNIYESSSVTFEGLFAGTEVFILSEDNESVIASGVCEEDSITFSLEEEELPNNYRIRILDGGGDIILEELVANVVGGDVYSLNSSLLLYINNRPMRKQTGLGHLSSGVMHYIMTLKNPFDYHVDNIKVRIRQDKEAFGYEWTTVAYYNLVTREIGDFEPELLINELEPNGEYHFILRIMREDEVDPPLDASFLVQITGDPRLDL